MPSWNVGNVTIRDAFGCSGDYDAWHAENLVDEWFRDYDSDRTLREICCHLGVSAHGRDGQRKAIKRAFRDRKLRADRRSALGPPPGDAGKPPLPVGRPEYEPAREAAAIRFRLVERDSFRPLEGVGVVIELPDGARQEIATDAAGEIYLTAPSGTSYKLLEIRAPYSVTRIQTNG